MSSRPLQKQLHMLAPCFLHDDYIYFSVESFQKGGGRSYYAIAMAGDLASRLLADLFSSHVGMDLARPFRIVLSCLVFCRCVV